MFEREKVAEHMQANVFTIARLKHHLKQVSHPMPEHVDKLSSLLTIKLQQPCGYTGTLNFKARTLVYIILNGKGV